jgi:sialate O-acetylesterase
LLRLFAVPKIASLTPVEEINAVADKPDIAHWEVCTPESITKAGVWGGFSALGYFFGREIQRNKGGPVGLIGAYWGGTPAQAWISSEGLAKDPALSEYITERQTRADALAKAQADYPAKKTAYEALLAKSNQASSPAADAPKPPAIPGVGSGTPTALFNGIIAPILPYAIQGAIWYQGESNAGNEHSAKLYHALFSDMITDWRAKFYEGDFPFLYVQLAAFGQNAKFWPYLRESQFETLSLPNVGMVSAIDIGDPACVHPGDKLNVGSRLALAAEHLAYGKNVVYSGPLYDKMSVEKDGIHLTFTQTGGGLKIGAPPTFASGVTPPPADKLVGFVIAGSDQHWFPADAKIVGNEVIVSSPQVASPVAVRYAWEQMPTINFYNKEGLPASPFRTDDWEEIETTPAPLKK